MIRLNKISDKIYNEINSYQIINSFIVKKRNLEDTEKVKRKFRTELGK